MLSIGKAMTFYEQTLLTRFLRAAFSRQGAQTRRVLFLSAYLTIAKLWLNRL